MKKFLICIMLSMSLIGCSSSKSTNNNITETESTTISNQSSTSSEEQQEGKLEAFDIDIKNNSLAINSDETLAIVSNSTIPEIKIYDLNEEKVIATLNEFVTPRNIAFSKDNSHFYISDSTYGNIREFNSETFELTRTFDLEQGVFGFTLTNAGDKIFANNQALSTVTVIDLKSGNVEKIIEGFSQPRQGIIIDDNDEFVYVTNFKGDDVRVVNTATLEIEKTLKGIPSVRAISVDDKGKYLYGASSSENSINVVDIETGELVKSIAVGQEPYGAALSPDQKLILTGEKASNQVSVINTETLEVISTIEGLDEPRQAIVYSSNDNKAYVLNKDLSISLIDYSEGNIIKTIK